ncbi:DUF1311 domain-containing protein [Bacillus sp. NP157]|nr:DUF1311 domain-containing protein [Bacillus sp. NP157]
MQQAGMALNAVRHAPADGRPQRSVLALLVGLGLFSAALSARAQDAQSDDIQQSSEAVHLRQSYVDCMGGGGATTAALLKCAHDEFQFQDKRLNRQYKLAMSLMSADRRLALRDDERRWLDSKKKRCALPADGGTADQVASADCEVQETARRATFLEMQGRK